jgi:predicted nucleic acid-binding protein
LSSDIRSTLRRIKPEKRTGQLARRPLTALSFFQGNAALPKVLLDTTVYVDVDQGTLPDDIDFALAGADIWHSSFTEAELVFLCGNLDPSHPASAGVVERITVSIEQRPRHRTLAPDAEIWREAGIYSGIVARLQNIDKTERMSVLHDALIFCTAMKHGLAVFSRNVRDFDLLQQLAPSGKVLFYTRQD